MSRGGICRASATTWRDSGWNTVAAAALAQTTIFNGDADANAQYFCRLRSETAWRKLGRTDIFWSRNSSERWHGMIRRTRGQWRHVRIGVPRRAGAGHKRIRCPLRRCVPSDESNRRPCRRTKSTSISTFDVYPVLIGSDRRDAIGVIIAGSDPSRHLGIVSSYARTEDGIFIRTRRKQFAKPVGGRLLVVIEERQPWRRHGVQGGIAGDRDIAAGSMEIPNGIACRGAIIGYHCSRRRRVIIVDDQDFAGCAFWEVLLYDAFDGIHDGRSAEGAYADRHRDRVRGHFVACGACSVTGLITIRLGPGK